MEGINIKKLLFISLILFVITGCSSNKSSNNPYQDYPNYEDSIHSVFGE